MRIRLWSIYRDDARPERHIRLFVRGGPKLRNAQGMACATRGLVDGCRGSCGE
jgi:hypothetical protein